MYVSLVTGTMVIAPYLLASFNVSNYNVHSIYSQVYIHTCTCSRILSVLNLQYLHVIVSVG